MLKPYRLTCMVFALLLGGCNTSLPKMAYSVVDNLRVSQCEKAMHLDCKSTQGYDDYQRERREVSQ